MTSNLLKIVFAVCSFLWLGEISASEAGQHKNPFHEIVKLTSSDSNDTLSTKALKSLLNTLGERIKNLKDCFSLEKLGGLIPTGGDISDTGFANISGILIDFITTKNCSDVSKHITTKPHVDDIIRSLHLIGYESKDGIKTCFNAFALRESSGYPSQLHATIILYLYEGRCILPDSSYFLTEYQSYFKNVNGVASKEVFKNLLFQLGIGGEDHDGNSTGGHDSDEDDLGDSADHSHGNHSSKVHDHDGDGGSNHDQDELNRTRRDADEEHDVEHLKERCFSAEQLMDIYEIGGEITKEKTVKLCPALVQQLKSGACKANENNSQNSSTPHYYTEAMAYGYGTASIAIISSLALIGFILFPVLKIKSFKLVMQFFIGLAIGTMAADAFLDVIPHALGVHRGVNGQKKDLTYIWKMSVVAGGVYIFFFFENCLKLWKITHAANYKTDKAHEVYANTPQLKNSSEDVDSENSVTSNETTTEEILDDADIVCCNFTTHLITVFVGDILHNFADGGAIGVAFAQSWSSGIATSIVIACHELPHEISDFAIYLKNGASKWQAVRYNFAAACCAFAGMYSGVAIGREEVVRSWVLAVVAGIFLYISLVHLMNEMVREQTTKPVLQFIMQNLGLVLGWAIILVIELYKDKIEASIR